MLYRNFATESEINDQYDPGVISDRVAAIERFDRLSEAALREIPDWYSHRFGSSDAEYVDIFLSGEANAPVHIFIHGGYWRALSARQFTFIARELVKNGVTVVLTNHELCPQVRIGDIVSQTRDAVSWVANNASKLNIDPSRISISGHSAGGHLVAMMLATDWSSYGLQQDLFVGAISLSGLFDLRPFPHSWLQPSLNLTKDEVIENSPIFLPVSTRASVLLRYGGLEQSEFARQSQAYAEHLTASHVFVDCRAIERADHFTVLDPFFLGELEFVNDILSFG